MSSKRYFISLLLACLSFTCAKCHIYGRYTSEKLDNEHIKDFKEKHALRNCSIEVKECTPHEGSRVDGTCNNYKYPARGSAEGPYLRLLEPEYFKGKEIRMNRNGRPLPSARKVRTTVTTDGQVVDETFNIAAADLQQIVASDVSVLNGAYDYIIVRQHCCYHEGKHDPRCIPIKAPDDDRILDLAHIRCLNMSRAETFQNRQCIPYKLTPDQVNIQTPLMDLSHIYGTDDDSLETVRAYHDGLLKMQVRNGRYLPLNDSNPENCPGNKGNETICYRFGVPVVGNFDLRLSTMLIFFMREHNRIAKLLKEINPCWKDDRLFKVARQINIATYQNIYWYELMPNILGRQNMLKYGLISERVEHLKAYDEDLIPLVYAEYEIATRFFETMIDDRIKMYRENYHFDGAFSLTDTIWRPSLLEDDKNIEKITRGLFYQPAAKIDDILDPQLVEFFFSQFQKASDLMAISIQRGRDIGLRGYNDYRYLCGLKQAKKFEDFHEEIDWEKIVALKNLYEEVEEVDLLAGILSEKLIPGTFVGPTLFCVMSKQMRLWRYADRFWFERGDQYHSFTIPQLQEIRKTNMAKLACDNGDGVKYIQPRALLNVGPGNEHTPCTHIPGPDLTKWRDSCRTDEQDDSHQHRYSGRHGDVHTHSNFYNYF